MEKTPIFDLTNLKNGITIRTSSVFSFYTHTHLYNEMVVYEPFDGYISLNNERTVISTPSIALITTSSFHSTHINERTNAKCLKISFTNDMVSSYFANMLNNSVVLEDYSTSPLLCELIEKLATSNESTEYKKILLDNVLLKLFESGRRVRSVESMNVNTLVTATLNIINSRFNENISLNSVARSLNVTPQYLSFVFSKSMNISFSKYLTDMRLRYAAGLLSENTLNITEICYSCGYRNLSHFIRSFKQKYGVSPNKFNS